MLSWARCTHKKQPCDKRTRQGHSNSSDTSGCLPCAGHQAWYRAPGTQAEHSWRCPWTQRSRSIAPSWRQKLPLVPNPPASSELHICIFNRTRAGGLLPRLSPSASLLSPSPGKAENTATSQASLAASCNQPTDPGEKIKGKQPGPWPPPRSGQEHQHYLGAWATCRISGSTPDLSIQICFNKIPG